MAKKNQGGSAKKGLASKGGKTVSSNASGTAVDQPVEASQPGTDTAASGAEQASSPVGGTNDSTATEVAGRNDMEGQVQETQAAETVPGQIRLVRSDKERSTQMVVYGVEGRPGSVRFSKTLFKDKQPPANVTLFTDAFAGPKEARVEETKEQRKARLAALPKPTAAEKMARLEQKLDRLRAKAAKETPAAGETAGDQAAQ